MRERSGPSPRPRSTPPPGADCSPAPCLTPLPPSRRAIAVRRDTFFFGVRLLASAFLASAFNVRLLNVRLRGGSPPAGAPFDARASRARPRRPGSSQIGGTCPHPGAARDGRGTRVPKMRDREGRGQPWDPAGGPSLFATRRRGGPPCPAAGTDSHRDAPCAARVASRAGMGTTPRLLRGCPGVARRRPASPTSRGVARRHPARNVSSAYGSGSRTPARAKPRSRRRHDSQRPHARSSPW